MTEEAEGANSTKNHKQIAEVNFCNILLKLEQTATSHFENGMVELWYIKATLPKKKIFFHNLVP